MVNGKFALFQRDNLGDLREFDAHIYIICRSPRLTIDSGSVRVTREFITGQFQRRIGDQLADIPFRSRNNFGTELLRIQSTYPYSWMEIRDGDDAIRAAGKSAVFAMTLGIELDLEVLYVGQAFGDGGERTAIARLQSHETLQAIYAKAIAEFPDQEIWIVISDFVQNNIYSIDGTSPFSVSAAEDDTHTSQLLTSEIPERQLICLTEAALIRHFQPPYNKKFKDTFPDPRHKTYAECYDLDINTVAVELHTPEDPVRFWSQAVPASDFHFAVFPLHSEAERRAMFDFFQGTS